jgi:hypothetical protein
VLAFFLLVIIIAISLGIIGFVVQGLLWLLIIGVVIFLLDFLFLGSRMSRRRRPSR